MRELISALTLIKRDPTHVIDDKRGSVKRAPTSMSAPPAKPDKPANSDLPSSQQTTTSKDNITQPPRLKHPQLLAAK